MYYISQLKNKGEKSNVLIYGAGKMGLITKTTLERDEDGAYSILGFIDDEKKGRSSYRKKIIHPQILNNSILIYK